MPIRGPRKPLRIALSIVAGIAPGLVLPAAAAGAAADPGPASEVVIVDLPERQRAEPRVVRLIGETADFGVALVRESDSGPWEGLLVADDGSTESIPTNVSAVFGNRLVRPGASGEEVLTRVLPSTAWTSVAVPAGYRQIGSTEQGLLLVSTAAPIGLALLPWHGGDPRPVDGVPAGTTGISPSLAGDTGLSVARVWGAGAVDVLLVDSKTREAWPLDVARSGCGTDYGVSWAVNDGTVAWRSETMSGDAVICTMPAPGSGGLGTAFSRAVPVEGPATRDHQFALVPVGDEVVVTRVAQPRPSTGQDLARPVEAVSANGSMRRLAGFGTTVAAGRPGHLLLVGGDSPADAAVRRIPVTGTGGQLLLPLPPVRAKVVAIAVDDGRVVYRDQSEPGDAVVEAELDTALHRVTRTGLLDSWVAGSVAAQEGAVSWFSQRAGTGHLKLRRAGASDIVADVSGGGPLGSMAHVSGDHVLPDPMRLVDFGTGTVTSLRTGSADLQDGVLYQPGSATTNGPTGSVIARDLRTGLAEQIDVPTCAKIHSLQVAGSWLMVHCTRPDGTHPRIVVDRSGAVAPFEVVSGPGLRLGNGFLARRESLNPIEWTPLQGGAVAWRQLDGSVPIRFAVNRGQVPLLAWSSDSGRVARLPVVPSPLPAKPDDVAAPASPEVTVTPLDQRLRLDWGSAPADSSRNAVILTVGGTRTVLPGDAAGKILFSLPNGVERSVKVEFENIAGTASSTVTGTPLAPPAAPHSVRVEVDGSGSDARVTWGWSPNESSEPLRSFEVWAGDTALVTDLEPGTRSATVPWDDGYDGRVVVRAMGTRQFSASGEPAVVRRDGVAPRAWMKGLPQASSQRVRTLRLRASDDVALARRPIDVRWRRAETGSPLGRWQAPSRWQRVAAAPLRVTGLQRGWRYCFSVRAHDRAGNVARWSPQVCTRVTR